MLPTHILFWDYFFNVIAFGFGFARISWALGILCLSMVFLPIVGIVIERRRPWPPWLWGSLSMTLGLLAAFAAIALGRAGYGIAQSKASRYSEFGMMLIPLTLTHLWYWLNQRPQTRVWVVALFWFFLFGTFANHWRV